MPHDLLPQDGAQPLPDPTPGPLGFITDFFDPGFINRPASFEQFLDPAAHDRAAPGGDPQAHAAASDVWDRLLRGLPKDRRSILADLLAGYSRREAAERNGVSPETVKRLLRDCRRRLGGRVTCD